MSQGQPQPRRPSAGGDQQQHQDQDQAGGAIRYGDVFPGAVHGGLAEKPVSPQDAATMQSAENLVFGATLKGGPAAAMQSAASRNERTGAVAHDQATVQKQGVCVPGARVVTEFVAGQAVGQYLAPDADADADDAAASKITIGEALEAASFAAGRRPVERSDAAAIQAAEVRATGLDVNVPGGLAAQAQKAADANERAASDRDKTMLGDVLSNATEKLLADKAVESEDAARVAFAEARNKEDATARPGGVAASMAAAARINRDTA